MTSEAMDIIALDRVLGGPNEEASDSLGVFGLFPTYDGRVRVVIDGRPRELPPGCLGYVAPGEE